MIKKSPTLFSVFVLFAGGIFGLIIFKSWEAIVYLFSKMPFFERLGQYAHTGNLIDSIIKYFFISSVVVGFIYSLYYKESIPKEFRYRVAINWLFLLLVSYVAIFLISPFFTGEMKSFTDVTYLRESTIILIGILLIYLGIYFGLYLGSRVFILLNYLLSIFKK